MSALAVPRETVSPVATFDEVLLELVDVDDNVRTDVGELEELKASIHELGVIQPIKVTAQPNGRFRVVWGQRRVLACRELGRLRIPAIVEPPSDVDVHGARRSIEQLSENLQRKDLNPIEEAVALREVLDTTKGLTQEALADKLGMSRPWVSNTLGLLDTTPTVQAHIREGRLTPSHVKALRGLAPKTQDKIAQEAIQYGASAHRVESMVQDLKRNEEWRKEQEARARKEAEAMRERYQAAIDKRLAKAAKDVRIVVSTGGYGHAQQIAEQLEATGFTNVTQGRGITSRAAAADCDCVVWKVESTYNGLTISAGCVVEKHQRAKAQATDAAREAKYKLEQRTQKAIREQLSARVGASPFGKQTIHLEPLVARMALWQLLDYGLGDWSVAHGGKSGKPWDVIVALDEEQLAIELAKTLGTRFRDHYNYHLPWEQLAAEFGVPIEEPKPVPAKRGKKAGTDG